jgi:hypothetical protein
LYYRSIGVLEEIEASTGIGNRTADLRLSGNQYVETKAWDNWQSFDNVQQARMIADFSAQLTAYLNVSSFSTHVEFKGSIPPQAEAVLNGMQGRANGRLTWGVV